MNSRTTPKTQLEINLMKKISILAAGLMAAASLGTPVFAQEMKHEKMGDMMDEHHSEMMQKHKQMEAAMQKEDAELATLAAKMNSATGDDKVAAIAAVLNKLVELRKQHHEEMSAMHDSRKGRAQENIHHMTSPTPPEAPANP